LIRAIFACDRENGIGKTGTLPWAHNSEDLKWFKKCTDGDVVIMGRRTWNDHKMPKPLPNRYNIVISSQNIPAGPNVVLHSVKSVEHHIKEFNQDIWIIGGKHTFDELMYMCEEVWISRINGVYDCDTRISDLVDFELYFKSYDVDKNLRIEKYRRSL
jgi:dihydrofolate reductase